MLSNLSILSAIRAFLPHLQPVQITPLGKGHIHSTLLVETNEVKQNKYVLQTLNTTVFPHIAALEHNHQKLQAHFYQAHPNSNHLHYIPSQQGTIIWSAPDGLAYRLSLFIENSICYETIQSPEMAFEAASAFGSFLYHLKGLDPGHLKSPIPHFHHAAKRLECYNQAILTDTLKRVQDAPEIIAFLNRHAAIGQQLISLQSSDQLPIRITHNDCKLNNVLFNRSTQKAETVIDLDTVMPGLVIYDFGDLVRTAVCPVQEDETDLSKIHIRHDIYRALLSGYLKGTAQTLTASEKKHLYFGGIAMTYIQCMRFLTDYLLGDIYFKISQKQHNLKRAANQMVLCQALINERHTLDCEA